MSAKTPENPQQGAPLERDAADLGTSMNRDANGHGQQAADLTNPQAADEALIAWDDLDEQLLTMLAEDPEHGRRLRKLQDADSWLRSRAAESARRTGGSALLECPTAEDLYEFGQGPGGSSLTPARRDAIDRHLATCRECEKYVETLTVPPPPPLLLGLPDDEADEDVPSWTAPTPVRPLKKRGPRRVMVGVGLAAAAAVVAVIGLRSLETPKLHFPQAPILRGSAGGPILYPRGHVLMPSAEVKALFPVLGEKIEYQIEPRSGASQYRLLFMQHEPGAFGKDILVKRQDTPETNGFAPIPFAQGNYTLQAWAVVNGLDQRWGEHGFDIGANKQLDGLLLNLGSMSEPERTMSAIQLLDSRGYACDARALARTLPPSPARDEYLSQSPGR